MIATMNAIQHGIANYTDKYMLPNLTGTKKIVAGTLIGIYLNGLPNLINGYAEKAGLSQMGIVTEQGIEIDYVTNILKEQIEKNGNKMTISLPLMGDFTIDSQEIENLLNEIKSLS